MNKREYAKANLDWLAAKAEEEGVIALPEGIYYKVLSSGNNDGKHPTPRSIVTAHYTGRTINGKKFDSSRGGAPITFRLSDLINPNRSLEKASCHFLMTAIRKTALYMLDS